MIRTEMGAADLTSSVMAAPEGETFFELGMKYASGRSGPADLVTAHRRCRPREACSPGSFGSRLFEDGERLVAMFGEVLLALDGTVPPASMDGEGGVSQGGEGLGGVAGSGAAGVLAAGPIADVVQAVLDSPMPARDVEQ